MSVSAKRRVLIALTVAAAFIALPFAASPAVTSTVFTWSPVTGCCDLDWNSPTNWTPNGVPGPDDQVVIDTGGFSGEPTIETADAQVGSITVGNLGALEINHGHSLTVSGAFSYDSQSNLRIGNSTTGTGFDGTLNLSGPVSLDPPSGLLPVTMIHGRLNLDSSLATNKQIQVTGGGDSLWHVTQNGSMTLNPDVGGIQMSVPFDNDGAVHVENGTLELFQGDTSSTSGSFELDSAATLLLDSGAPLDSPSITGAGTVTTLGNLTVGASDVFSVDTLNLQGGTTTLNRDVVVPHFSTLNAVRSGTGTLTVTSTADLGQGATKFTGGGTTTIASTVSPVTLGQSDTVDSATLNLDAPVTLTAPHLDVFNSGVLNVDARLTISSGMQSFGGGLVHVGSGGSMIVDPGGSGVVQFVPPVQSNGTVSLQSGQLEVDQGLTVDHGGTLKGNGTIIGSVTNTAGTVAPGNSPGAITIQGSYTQSSDGTLAEEITGTAPGSQFDQLDVTGGLTLAGTLAIDSTGFTPSAADTFRIIDGASSRTGTFDTVTGATAGGFVYTPQYDGNGVTLGVAAAPPPTDVIVTDCNDPSLAQITTIAGNLVVQNLPGCTSLNLGSLHSVGGSIDISSDSSLTTIDISALTTIGGNVDISNDPALTSFNLGGVNGVGGNVTIDGNLAANSVNLGGVNSVGGSITIDGNLAANTVNLGSVAAVGTTSGGSLDVSGNSAATVVNLGGLQTVGGSVDLETAGSTVNLGAASVGGNITLTANGADTVSAKTAGGTTDVNVTGGTAAMHVVIPSGAFDQPVPFTVTRQGDSPPAPGTAADGSSATIDPVAGYHFSFAVPTLNQDAQLTFTVDLSQLDVATRSALLAGTQNGSATIAVQGDAAGSLYQAFARCTGNQTPSADGCVDAALLDANGLPVQSGGTPAFVRFDGVTGHFSSYAVALVTRTDTTPPAVTVELTAPNGGTPDGQNGWFVNGPVNGTVRADDTKTGGSEITKLDCGSLVLTTTGIGTPNASGSFSIAVDGVTHIACTATDSAGNMSPAASKDVQLDTVKPTLAPTIAPTPILLHGGATATSNATDATSGVASQSCGAVDTSTVGAHTVTCSATDNAGNAASVNAPYTVVYATGGDCLGSPGHQILQPVHADGTSVFKQGSTAAVKFRVCDANGNSIGTAGVASAFKLIQTISGTVVTTVNEAVDSTTPDTSFRWDPVGQQWIFNLSTKSLSANTTYVYDITLNDGTHIGFRFGLK